MELNEYKTAHRELWDWLSRNPGKEKDEWPGWEAATEGCGYYCGERIQNFCFMCAWTIGHGNGCRSCPLTQKSGTVCYLNGTDTESTGIFQQWCLAMGDDGGEPDYAAACRIASEIRDAWEDA